MIAILLKLGGWITDHPKLFVILVFIAGGLLGVLAGRRMCATPTIKEEATATTAAIAQTTQDTKTQEGPWSADTWYFGRPGSGTGMGATSEASPTVPTRPSQNSVAPAVPRTGQPTSPPQAPLIAFRHEEHGPTASETHASAESAQSTTQTLHLEQQGSLAAQWALSAGFENLLHDKALRLSVRRKFLGPIWVEGAFTPATRAVGAGIAIQF